MGPLPCDKGYPILTTFEYKLRCACTHHNQNEHCVEVYHVWDKHSTRSRGVGVERRSLMWPPLTDCARWTARQPSLSLISSCGRRATVLSSAVHFQELMPGVGSRSASLAAGANGTCRTGGR